MNTDTADKTYRYLPEENLMQNIPLKPVLIEYDVSFVNVLVYHITEQTKYPFIQFMLEKIPVCMDIFKEQFGIPKFFIPSSIIVDNIEECILDKIKSWLREIGCNTTNITVETSYKGFQIENLEVTVFINVSNVDITGLYLDRNAPCWFVLATEILNNHNVCNIEIDFNVGQIYDFTKYSKIHNINATNYYPIPDVVYSGAELKQCKFQSIFGQKMINNLYYIFDTCFYNAVKNGGWNENNDHEYKFNELITDSDTGRYVKGGINRYAFFVETFDIIVEKNIVPSLLNDLTTLEDIFQTKDTIYINNHTTGVIHIVCKSYDQHVPLSYHKLDKRTLGTKWMYSQKYRIE